MSTTTPSSPTVAPRLQYDRLTGTLGAEVSGIDLARPIDDATINELSAALVEHKVLFFREQPIDTAQHLAFSLRFGQSEPYSLAPLKFLNWHPNYPDVALVESTPQEFRRADIWHSDTTFQAAPSFGSILHCVVPAKTGGDTLWADMEAAYEGLDDTTKSLLSGLVAIHDWRGQIPSARKNGVSEETIRAVERALPPVEHPVLRTHPVSRRKSIYVNEAFTKCIKGMSETESDALLRRLYALARVPEYQVRFRWRKDSIAFWDNRSTQHYAVADYLGQHRRMERVTFVGDRPF